MLEQIIFESENTSLWHKDPNSIFVDIKGHLFKSVFGVKQISHLIDKTDYDFPYISESLANEFRMNDAKIINENKTFKFLEISQRSDNEWTALFTVKSPYMKDNQCIGTLGHCISLPKSILKLGLVLGNKLSGSRSLSQASYSLENIHENLTRRENEVLFFLLRGKTSKETALILKISDRTVEHHVDSIKSKFNCKNKRELIELSFEKKYFHIIPETLITQDLSIIL